MFIELGSVAPTPAPFGTAIVVVILTVDPVPVVVIGDGANVLVWRTGAVHFALSRGKASATYSRVGWPSSPLTRRSICVRLSVTTIWTFVYCWPVSNVIG